MIPESYRLFGQDHAVKQNDRDHERFILKRSCSRFEFSLCAVALDRADRFHNLAVEMPLECAKIGTATARPTNSSKKPIARLVATISPHSAMVKGFSHTAFTEVKTPPGPLHRGPEAGEMRRR